MKTYSSILPGAVLLLAAALFLRYAPQWDSFSAFVGIYPYVVWVAGVLLGWRFNRSRLVFAVLVLALGDQALLRYFPAGSGGDTFNPVVFGAVAFLLPINLAAISLITERGFGTPRGLARLGLILIQLVLVAWIIRPEQAERASWLDWPIFEIGVTGWTPLPQPALLAFVGAFILLAVRFLLHRSAIESGFVWATAAAFFGLHAGEGRITSTVYLSTAGFILVIAVIETSYSMAYRDELSGLPARRALNEALLQLGSGYAVAMVDVDHFKKFNDEYGHDVGDQVLRMVASRLLEVSGGGKAFRYGGEEFTVIFSGKSAEEALPHLETVRGVIERSSFALRGKGRPRKKPPKPKAIGRPRKEVSVTVSVGVAEPDRRHTTPDQVIKAADKALYRAKKGGRNQVQT